MCHAGAWQQKGMVLSVTSGMAEWQRNGKAAGNACLPTPEARAATTPGQRGTVGLPQTTVMDDAQHKVYSSVEQGGGWHFCHGACRSVSAVHLGGFDSTVTGAGGAEFYRGWSSGVCRMKALTVCICGCGCVCGRVW